jgi:hypothetical protein
MEISRREALKEIDAKRFRLVWIIRELPTRFSMAFIISACLPLLLVLSCFGEAAEQKTEIIVIGVAERETQNFKIQDLVGILKNVKPDVILFESPAEMMTPSYEFKIMPKDSLPHQAVLEYVKQTGIKIRPFDIDNRDAFYARTHAEEVRCNQELNEANNTNKMGSEAQKIFDLLIAANKKLAIISQSDAIRINSFSSDMTINERHWLVHEGIPEIVRLTPELKGCAEFWDLDRAEWIRRNNQMIANIKKYSTQFQGQLLVVICGFEHRYYLHSHLYDWREDPPNYTVKEYWQY